MGGDGRALAAQDEGDFLIALALRDPVQDHHFARRQPGPLDQARLELVDPQMGGLGDGLEDGDVGMFDPVLMVDLVDAEGGQVLMRAESGEGIAIGHPVFARLFDEMPLIGRKRFVGRHVAEPHRPPGAGDQRREGVEQVEAVIIPGDPFVGEAEGYDIGLPGMLARGFEIAQSMEAVRAIEGPSDGEYAIRGCCRGNLPYGPTIIHGGALSHLVFGTLRAAFRLNVIHSDYVYPFRIRRGLQADICR